MSADDTAADDLARPTGLGAPAAAPDEPFLNPFEPGFFDDPYRQYRVLRERVPIQKSPLGTWLVTRYDDVARIMRDPSVSSNERTSKFDIRAPLLAQIGEHRRERGTQALLNLDPPDHTRIRQLVAKAFTASRVETMTGRIRTLLDEILDAAADAGHIDVIADLAFPLPFTVISELLGIPVDTTATMRNWAHTLTMTLEPLVMLNDVPALIEASDNMTAHVEAAIEEKRRNPRNDLLSALVTVEEQGAVLSPRELVDTVVLLYVAGHETSVNLIGNGVLTLLQHPDQLERLRADPALDTNALEEILRYQSPVQFTRRITTRDLDVGTDCIEAGSFIFCCVGSANHDPSRFGPTAEEFDITRSDAAQHIAFGTGIHHCLGNALARAESRLAVGTLVRRFPGLALTNQEPDWAHRMVLRGLESLPVTLH